MWKKLCIRCMVYEGREVGKARCLSALDCIHNRTYHSTKCIPCGFGGRTRPCSRPWKSPCCHKAPAHHLARRFCPTMPAGPLSIVFLPKLRRLQSGQWRISLEGGAWWVPRHRREHPTSSYPGATDRPVWSCFLFVGRTRGKSSVYGEMTRCICSLIVVFVCIV